VITLDPSNFKETHVVPYESIVNLGPVDKTENQFYFDAEKVGNFVFQTPHRAQLLCQLFECATKATNRFRSKGVYRALRQRKYAQELPCVLTAASFAIIELDESNRITQEYKYVNLSQIGIY